MDVAIIGGTGFIGQHLVKMLIINDQINKIRLLYRSNKKIDFVRSDKLELICGDIFSPASLSELIVEGAIVVNLAFLADSSKKYNMDLINNILVACKRKKAQKLIHCSTAVVCGRAKESLITEATSCSPYSKYDETKLQVEKLILDKKDLDFDTIILRPTAVFGANGKNLLQLSNDLYFGSRLKNYFKSCIYGHRTMNLVSVVNVVSSITFLILYRNSLSGEIYIIADDEVKQNNYISLEKELMHIFGIKDYIIPRFFVPYFVLKLILRLLRKSNIDPMRRYSSSKLVKLGWSNSSDFNSEIKDFAVWFKETHTAHKLK